MGIPMMVWTSPSSELMFDNVVRVKRPPPINASTGVRGAPVTVYENLPMTQIDPISRETLQREVTGSPIDMFEGFTYTDCELFSGDEVVELSTERTFKIRAALLWPEAQYQLVLELQKST